MIRLNIEYLSIAEACRELQLLKIPVIGGYSKKSYGSIALIDNVFKEQFNDTDPRLLKFAAMYSCDIEVQPETPGEKASRGA